MFALYPDDLGIILTYQCASGCAHCLYNCSPRRKDVMTEEGLRDALDALAVYPRKPQVHLTGGEPFLHYPLLLEGVRMAAERDIWVYVETSAAWCVDEDAAVDRFAALQRAGLQAVLISCSPFHAVRIPPARTVRAIRAARRVFSSDRVLIYLSQFLPVIGEGEETTPLSHYEKLYGREGARQLFWDGYGLIPGGRSAYQLGYLAHKQPAAAFADQDCAWTLLYAQHSHFDLHGHVIPSFCGGITVGDWHDLPQLLADFQAGRYPPLIALLVEEGPYGLFRLAEARYGYEALPEGYVGRCHLCVDVRRHLVAQGAEFPELQPAAFYENF